MNSSVLAVVTAVMIGQADAAAEVEKAIQALNQAFERGDPKVIERLMTANHVAVTPYYGGPQSRAAQLKTLADLKMSEYTPANLKVTLLGPDVALVTYRLALKGTYQGKPLPRNNYASAIWVREGGKWLEAYYQETALEP